MTLYNVGCTLLAGLGTFGLVSLFSDNQKDQFNTLNTMISSDSLATTKDGTYLVKHQSDNEHGLIDIDKQYCYCKHCYYCVRHGIPCVNTVLFNDNIVVDYTNYASRLTPRVINSCFVNPTQNVVMNFNRNELKYKSPLVSQQTDFGPKISYNIYERYGIGINLDEKIYRYHYYSLRNVPIYLYGQLNKGTFTYSHCSDSPNIVVGDVYQTKTVGLGLLTVASFLLTSTCIYNLFN